MKGIFERFSGESEPVDIDAETVYEFLSNERRSNLVRVLDERPVGEELALSDLADELSERGDVRDHAYISLIQHVAPAYPSILRYNDDKQTIVVTPEVEAIAEAQKQVENVVNG
jgi:hypothetical protein